MKIHTIDTFGWSQPLKYTNVSWDKNTHSPERAKQKRVDPDLTAPRGAI